MLRIKLITAILVVLIFSEPGAEVLGILDVVPKIFKTKELKRTYALRLDELIYSSESVSDFLVLTTAIPESTYVAGKLNIKFRRSETFIFDHENYYSAIKGRSFVSLIPEMNAYLVSSPHGDSAYKNEMFGLSGELLNSFIGPQVNVSPDGKYFYTYTEAEDWQPLIIYDSGMIQKFQFPFEKTYVVNALPNGVFAAGEKDRVYLYNAADNGILWELDLPERSYVVDRSFNIRFSPGGSIIIARDMTQAHFIDVDGKSFWSNNRINKGYSIGISRGSRLASFAVGSHSYLIFQLFDYSGKIITEEECEIGPDLAKANVWDKEVYVNDNFQMARFTASDLKANEERFITGVCIRDKDRYHVLAVDGLWYYLEKNNREGTLVGFENDRKEIIGYSVILK
ncbi:MAG: hypothetical protein JSW64_07705 [Candidatus Zixiibacteriota bacterium]|nr:MAG: hypothetical protein JSW64_07705 [candidate division Zixibacteria bacterium]